METIYIEHPKYPEKLPELAIALGFFDGVHTGHQEVILKAKSEAEKRGLQSGVMTFFPHPKEVLRGGEKVSYLTSINQKEKIIAELGIDYLIIVKFDKNFSSLTPQQFVDNYLIHLNVKHAVAGFDYSYGRLGKGSMETLPFHSRDKVTSSVVNKVEANGEKISSTSIRLALEEGNIVKVNEFLGRPFEISGQVVKGEQRGRTIGFPTANIKPAERACIPQVGVYIVQLLIDGRYHKAVCNVGFKPTFHEKSEGEPTIEVHVLNFTGDLYNMDVTVRWLCKLRNEKKFESVDHLIDQLNEDVEKAKHFFQTEKLESFSNNT